MTRRCAVQMHEAVQHIGHRHIEDPGEEDQPGTIGGETLVMYGVANQTDELVRRRLERMGLPAAEEHREALGLAGDRADQSELRLFLGRRRGCRCRRHGDRRVGDRRRGRFVCCSRSGAIATSNSFWSLRYRRCWPRATSRPWQA